MTFVNYNDPRLYWTVPEPKLETHTIWPYECIDDLRNHSEKFYLINTMDRTIFDCFPAEEIIPSDVLDDMKQGKVTLLLRNIYHGHHSLVSDVYENFIVKHSVDPRNVLIASESADLDKEIHLVAQKFNLPPCRYRWTRLLEWSTRDNNTEISDTLHKNHYANTCLSLDTLTKKQYEKKYLSYNGNRTWSRSAVILLLKSIGVIDQGYVSYNSRHTLEELAGLSEMTYLAVYNALVNNKRLTTPSEGPAVNTEDLSPSAARIGELLEASKEELLQIDQLLLDNIKDNQLKLGEKEYYQNTYFSLVTETIFPDLAFWDSYLDDTLTDKGRLLSEKVFKPILAKHPFIVVSNPKTLELLRSIGYKTFHPFIDETYDTIEDHAARLLSIAEEVKRLCEMSEPEVYEFIDNVLPICDFNQKLLAVKINFANDIIL
jgi:hypothetical protein